MDGFNSINRKIPTFHFSLPNKVGYNQTNITLIIHVEGWSRRACNVEQKDFPNKNPTDNARSFLTQSRYVDNKIDDVERTQTIIVSIRQQKVKHLHKHNPPPRHTQKVDSSNSSFNHHSLILLLSFQTKNQNHEVVFGIGTTTTFVLGGWVLYLWRRRKKSLFGTCHGLTTCPCASLNAIRPRKTWSYSRCGYSSE